jgi:cold shock CspA family protein
VEGVVTKGIPRSGGTSFHHGNHSSRDDPHGLIEVKEAAEETEPSDKKTEGEDDAEADEPSKLRKRHKLVRFTTDSVAAPSLTEPDAEGGDEDDGAAKPTGGKGRKPSPPQFGDHVKFRIATHRKSGQRRAVDLTVTVSARARLEQEMQAKLASMTRELGVVARVKGSGGFVRCVERTEDVYFPFHEIRESLDDDNESTKPKGKGAKVQLREGDEVSFYVYEEKDNAGDERDRSGSSGRLTALRVVKVPAGTVSFEDVLRTDVEGVVTKIPKEPRNGPEVFGVINPTKPEDVVATEETPDDKKKLRKKAAGVSFRLSDAQDVSYVPATGDVLLFDLVLDKRSRRTKAANVRVVQLNPNHRETGVITTVKDDFGFIKCADRSADAYFRFSDVMSVHHDFRSGTEVAFDVSGGGGGGDAGRSHHGKDKDNIRALRVELLAPGTVQWETAVASDVDGEIVAVPSRSQKPSAHSKQGGASAMKPTSLKAQTGRIHLKLADGKHLIDFFPVYKQQIDAAFIKATGEGDSEDKDETSGECTLAFPPSLSKHERAAIHAYCDWLGLAHASTGDGSHRQLTVTAAAKLSPQALLERGNSTAEIEFHAEDAGDVRYNPRVGDRIKLNLVLVKRSKQLVGKRIVLVEAAPSKTAKANGAKDESAELPRGEGFIVAIKEDGGFGFIQPSDQGVTGAENLFFHMKEIVTDGAELREGVEVQYRVSHDEKKKKTRAVAITVVAPGTVQKVEAAFVRGVVHRPSLLQRLRKTNARFGGKHDKHKQQQMSSAGRIRLARAAEAAEADAEADGEEDDDVEEDEEDDEEAEAEEDLEAKADHVESTPSASAPKAETTKETKKPKKKTPAAASSYVYYISDIADPTVVLRDGDEVEFVPHKTPKGLRALRVRLVQSHAKQGVVTRVDSDGGGVLRVDGDEPPVDVAFTARNVLRGDLLGEGDRVEFALVKKPQVDSSKKHKKKKQAANGDADETEQADDEAPTPETTSALVATSVLCLGPRTAASKASGRDNTARPESRSVNSTLLQAMRQVGASAVAKSRMAKGPDGSRGFAAGWRTAASASTPPAEADAPQ